MYFKKTKDRNAMSRITSFSMSYWGIINFNDDELKFFPIGC